MNDVLVGMAIASAVVGAAVVVLLIVVPWDHEPPPADSDVAEYDERVRR